MDGLELLSSLSNNSIDLILTDPPYVISKDSGMNKFQDEVKEIEKSGENKKTEIEWLEHKAKMGYENDEYRVNYIKYGNSLGKKYGIKTEYGEWDSDFTIDTLKRFIAEFHRVLKKNGTLIIFFDLWKLETLKNILEENKFKKIRFIEWVKTNPVPINQKVAYLSNAREAALFCTKGSGNVFNSKYDNGIYSYPIYQGKKDIDRIHPTQKSLPLFEDIIKKHTNEGDMVLDVFGGSATTYIASLKNNRKCISSEIDVDYYNKAINRIKFQLDVRHNY